MRNNWTVEKGKRIKKEKIEKLRRMMKRGKSIDLGRKTVVTRGKYSDRKSRNRDDLNVRIRLFAMGNI